MKCSIKTTAEGTSTRIVKRRFVPVNIEITRKGQFVNTQTKLPFTAAKVIGVLTDIKANPCSDDPIPTRHYFGVSDTKMTDTRFLKSNSGKVYGGNYPPDVLIDVVPNHWWYYAHPVLDRFPVQIENGDPMSDIRNLEDPILIDIKEEGQCNAKQYYLWNGIFPQQGWVFITFRNDT